MRQAGEKFRRVVVSGPLTIRTINGLRDRLAAELANDGPVAVDCDEATEVDAAFIQLLLAARRSAQAREQDFRLWRRPDGALRTALQRGGFLGADMGGVEDDFWTITASEA